MGRSLCYRAEKSSDAQVEEELTASWRYCACSLALRPALISMKHVDRLGQEQHENHIGMWGVYVGKTTLLRFPSSEDNPGVDLFDDAYCRTGVSIALAGLSLAACSPSLPPCLGRAAGTGPPWLSVDRAVHRRSEACFDAQARSGSHSGFFLPRSPFPVPVQCGFFTFPLHGSWKSYLGCGYLRAGPDGFMSPFLIPFQTMLPRNSEFS